MHHLSRVIDEFLQGCMRNDSIRNGLEQMSDPDAADEALDAVQEALHTMSSQASDCVAQINTFSRGPISEKTQTKLRNSTAKLILSVESFNHALTNLHPNAAPNGLSLAQRLSGGEQQIQSPDQRAMAIAHEKVLVVSALDAEALKQEVHDVRQTHLSIARRINRLSALLEWESGLLEDA